MGCTLSSGDDTVTVSGRLTESGRVQISVNDETYTYSRDSGILDEGTVSAKLHADDGTRIEEGAVSQEIHLPDGTYIRRGAVSEKARLPDGTELTSNQHDNDSAAQLSVSLKSSSSSQSTKINISGGSVVIEQQEQRSTSVEADIPINNTSDIIARISLGVLFVGLFATFVFDVFGVLPAVLLAIAVYYTLLSVGTVYHSWNAETEDIDRQEGEELCDEELIEQQIEELKSGFASDDGDIDTIDEFEEQVGKLLDETTGEDAEVEVERVTA